MQKLATYRRIFVGSAKSLLSTNDWAHISSNLQAAAEEGGITGLFFYCDGNFVCIAEGDEGNVDNRLINYMNNVSLHEQLLLKAGAVNERVFDTWAVADCKTFKGELIAENALKRDETRVVRAAKSIINNMCDAKAKSAVA